MRLIAQIWRVMAAQILNKFEKPKRKWIEEIGFKNRLKVIYQILWMMMIRRSRWGEDINNTILTKRKSKKKFKSRDILIHKIVKESFINGLEMIIQKSISRRNSSNLSRSLLLITKIQYISRRFWIWFTLTRNLYRSHIYISNRSVQLWPSG